jgi:nicotinamidase-related amidase
VRKGSQIIFLADTHDPEDKEFRMFPAHCILGTPETEIILELTRFKGELMPKRRYSGFYDTPLDARLKELNPEKVIVVGVCTDICVMHTVADARNRDYVVEVPRHCVASFDAEAHAFALKHMERILGARIV